MQSKKEMTEETLTESQPESTKTPVLELPDVDGNTMLSYQAEVMENLRQLILRLSIDGSFPARFAFTSALSGEGVTYQVHALSTILAHDSNRKVLVVDMNWWHPSPHPYTAQENGGLAAVLAGKLSLKKAIIPSGWSNLSFMPAGAMDVLNRSKAARSDKLKDTITALSQTFDHLVLDIPAILNTSDSVPLLALADGFCLVIRQGVTPAEDVRLVLDTISHLHIYGVLLNQVKFAIPKMLMRLIPQT